MQLESDKLPIAKAQLNRVEGKIAVNDMEQDYHFNKHFNAVGDVQRDAISLFKTEASSALETLWRS